MAKEEKKQEQKKRKNRNRDYLKAKKELEKIKKANERWLRS